MKLGDFVKEKRLNLSMSQTDFGEHIGVSFVTINNIEKKHYCGLKTLRILSENLNVTTEKLREMMVEHEDNE